MLVGRLSSCTFWLEKNHSLFNFVAEGSNVPPMIWYMKRKRWRIGPKLPFAYDRLCSTSLSRTLVLIVSINFGNHSYNPGQEMIGRVVLFDFHTKNWNDAPTISVPPYYWMDCKMTINFDKTGNQEAVVLVNGKMIHHNFFRLSDF